LGWRWWFARRVTTVAVTGPAPAGVRCRPSATCCCCCHCHYHCHCHCHYHYHCHCHCHCHCHYHCHHPRLRCQWRSMRHWDWWSVRQPLAAAAGAPPLQTRAPQSRAGGHNTGRECVCVRGRGPIWEGQQKGNRDGEPEGVTPTLPPLARTAAHRPQARRHQRGEREGGREGGGRGLRACDHMGWGDQRVGCLDGEVGCAPGATGYPALPPPAHPCPLPLLCPMFFPVCHNHAHPATLGAPCSAGRWPLGGSCLRCPPRYTQAQ
jgi:hypothetical protein